MNWVKLLVKAETYARYARQFAHAARAFLAAWKEYGKGVDGMKAAQAKEAETETGVK